ncbi:iron complex transport system ATP-binding protein [Haladaptatus litoreus]|uniref:Cobalamin import ATP-binding protein BtuD n=1 Tax=Haladaptatus litoreus TaxID=553468 RepID=A0A1N6X404_9EURY|nr:ATP-binding cassette domain-containing protein [Haladaptatus litoreus]SIQ96999.1 iron complex transport system ATP-binding protein [Haladaptatus litoreus]
MIRIEDVSVTLGDSRVLDGVSARVPDGKFVGLVGPNGAGKTTLLRAMNGVLSPDSGRVLVDGDAIADLSSKAASRRVATVPQDTTLSFDFDVRDVVAMGRNPYRSRFGSGIDSSDRSADDGENSTSAAVVERAMERTDVMQFADRSITAVSGGERQRILLARALAQDTPVLLLDEPTASLDINHQVRTFELVRELVREGKTVVAAIHDLNLAAHYCDELLLLDSGSVLSSGPPTDVLVEDTLREAFDARAVVSSHPVTGSTYVTALPERATGRERDGKIHVVGGGGTVSRLLYVLSAAGYDVSVGVLNEGDSDLETARLLGLETVVEEPFAPIGSEAQAALEGKIRDADVTILSDVEIGSGNLANLEAVSAADSVVVVEERQFEARNYAGSAAVASYRELCERGHVVPPDDVLSAVEDAFAGES